MPSTPLYCLEVGMAAGRPPCSTRSSSPFLVPKPGFPIGRALIRKPYGKLSIEERIRRREQAWNSSFGGSLMASPALTGCGASGGLARRESKRLWKCAWTVWPIHCWRNIGMSLSRATSRAESPIYFSSMPSRSPSWRRDKKRRSCSGPPYTTCSGWSWWTVWIPIWLCLSAENGLKDIRPRKFSSSARRRRKCSDWTTW